MNNQRHADTSDQPWFSLDFCGAEPAEDRAAALVGADTDPSEHQPEHQPKQPSKCRLRRWIDRLFGRTGPAPVSDTDDSSFEWSKEEDESRLNDWLAVYDQALAAGRIYDQAGDRPDEESGAGGYSSSPVTLDLDLSTPGKHHAVITVTLNLGGGLTHEQGKTLESVVTYIRSFMPPTPDDSETHRKQGRSHGQCQHQSDRSFAAEVAQFAQRQESRRKAMQATKPAAKPTIAIPPDEWAGLFVPLKEFSALPADENR